MDLIKVALHLHVAAGAIALSSMLIPILSRKGGVSHRWLGWVFVLGMAVICTTALLVSGEAIRQAQNAHDRDFPIFLFCLSIFTGGLLSIGVRALRTKQRTERSRSAWDLGLGGLSLLAATTALVYGLERDRSVFVGFGFVAVPLCSVQLRYWLRAPQSKVHHILQHIVGMLGSCIAGLIAFTVINGHRFGLPRSAGVLWATPALVLGPVVVGWLIVTWRRSEKSTRIVLQASP